MPKIVIDIPEETYKGVLEAWETEKHSRFKCVVDEAIVNGIVLPKGHGRLIDIDNDLYDLDRRRVEYAPIIIEADKEDEPTICDNCIHDDVCGLEGHLEPALTYCGWKEERRSQGKWKKIGEEYYNWSNHDVIKCSLCGYVKDVPDLIMAPHFCEDCGADMRGVENV